MSRRHVAATAAVVALLAACSSGGPGPDGTTPPETQGARPASTATLRILEPTPGQVVEGGDVIVEVRLEGARLVKQVSRDIQPDEGHLHLRLDGATITLLGGLTETIPDVAPGRHALEVEFVAADHGFFDPRVIQLVTFEVR